MEAARWRRNNGLNDSREVGVNFATENDKIELGGSARYNYKKNRSAKDGYSENFLTGSGAGSSFNNSVSNGMNHNQNFNADFRLEWKPDSLTNIIFRPNFSYSKTDNGNESKSGTFNSDPYALVSNPNQYLNLDSLNKLAQADPSDWEWDEENDPLADHRVNTTNGYTSGDGSNLSASGTLQLNRRLNSRGRNITLRLRGNYSENENNNFNSSDTRYFQANENGVVRQPNQIRRYTVTPTDKYSYHATVTYSEPLWKSTFLQLSYRFDYNYSESDKKVYDLPKEWKFGTGLQPGYEKGLDKELSKYAEYNTYTHRATAALKFIRTKYQLNVGMDFEPQHTKLSYEKGKKDTIATRDVFNFAPNVDLTVRFSKISRLRFSYHGRSNQPGMENLLDVTDNSNPLDIREGNPGLKPSFNHSLRIFFNTYNKEHQRGIFSNVFMQSTQNSVSNKRTYIPETGGWITRPENINGNWSASGLFGINTALKNKKFTIGSFSRIRYNNNVGYLTTGRGDDAVTRKNTTTDLSLSERLNGTYRNDWLELGVNGTFGYNIERDKLTPENNQQPYTFSYGGPLRLCRLGRCRFQPISSIKADADIRTAI